jgi:hypothetical protein
MPLAGQPGVRQDGATPEVSTLALAVLLLWFGSVIDEATLALRVLGAALSPLPTYAKTSIDAEAFGANVPSVQLDPKLGHVP